MKYMKMGLLGLLSAGCFVLALMNLIAEQRHVSDFAISQSCFLLIGYSASVINRRRQGKPVRPVAGQVGFIALAVISALLAYIRSR